jgi:serine/threonine-protein kinase HipA
MDPEADSYEKLFAVCRKLHLPETDCQELFRRMVFNILANNTDDHHKNFTFVMNQQGIWRLSPAYDMTYIFDTGGYLPNKEHCLMIGGKYQDITLDDIISFASEIGIRAPKSIIRKVASAVSSFRSLAEKNEVKEEWTGRVESTIINHLKAWGEWQEEINTPELVINGHSVSNIRIEQAYKGNFYLLATIDGKERKYVIDKNREAFSLIEKTGIANLTTEQLKAMAETCFKLND